jgi:hypothetical protein
MALTRRTLLSPPIAIPLLNLAARAAAGSEDYFPPSDASGGWRTLNDPAEIRRHTGIDTSRLDAAFQSTQTTSQHGGLLVTRHGYLVYEKYFGCAAREAPIRRRPRTQARYVARCGPRPVKAISIPAILTSPRLFYAGL